MNRSIRNIVIMALFTVGGGWLGIWLNTVTGNTMPPLQSLGALVWLVSPALVGIALRAFAGDGWKDAGFGPNLPTAARAYVVVLLIYPIITLLMMGVALAIQSINIDGFITQGFGAYLGVLFFMLGASLMKNLFEEFAWRGYLTPRLEAAGVHPLLNHFIVGILWWSWHLPYYYYFLDRAEFSKYLGGTSVTVFLLTALFSIFPTALLFGEIRLLTKSVWPVFILHQMVNAVSLPLLLNGFITLNGFWGHVFSPTNDGFITSIVIGLAGFWFYRHRMQEHGG